MERRVEMAILLFGATLALSNLGVWVVRDVITSPASVDEMIETVSRLGIDRIYVQVVGRADAFYRSDILPRSEMLEDAPKDYDPLGYVLEKAKERGIKVSAWMNVFYAWPFGDRPKSPKHVVNAHPDWVTYDERGYSMFEYKRAPSVAVPGIFLDPGLDEVKEFVASVAEEIARKYDVDEIHLDYIRYPYRTFGYNPTVMRKYRKWVRKAFREGKVKDLSNAFDDFRRAQVTETVRLIKERVSKYGKRLSAAVYAYYEDAYNDRFQDWIGWLKDGILDRAVMMAYDDSVDTVRYYIEFARERLRNLKKVGVGLGLYKVAKRPDLLRELMEAAFSYEPDEVVLFSYKFISDENEGVISSFEKR